MFANLNAVYIIQPKLWLIRFFAMKPEFILSGDETIIIYAKK